jgi:ribonuclease P protein component
MTGLAIKTKSRNSRDKPLLLIAVSAKVSKKAVVRNFLKRRIRAIMRPIVKDSKFDYFIIVKPEATKMNYQELKNEVFNKLLITNY